VPPSESWYYEDVQAPASTPLSAFFEPILRLVGWTPPDPTYGRACLPFSPWERRIRDDPKITVHDYRVQYGPSEWISYHTWQDEGAAEKAGVEADFMFIHGINDAGHIFARHARRFLDAGLRVIILDLPGHGRSTGLHVYVPDMNYLTDGVHRVVVHHVQRDREHGINPQRKLFVSGASLGGYTAAAYCMRYHGPNSPPPSLTEPDGPIVSGVVLQCPLIEVSADSRPAYAVELMARGLSFFLGRLGFAAANKGRNTDRIEIEYAFESDPSTYHGKLRIATGLAILRGLTELESRLSEITVPLLVLHGTSDRVTSYHGSERLYQAAQTDDKQIELLEGYQHIILRQGDDEADDRDRQRALDIILNWLEPRSKR